LPAPGPRPTLRAPPDRETLAMSQQAANKELVRRFWDDVYVARDYDAIGSYFATDGVYVDVAVPESAATGPQAVAMRLRIGHEPVQRFTHEIHRMVAEGDTVVTEHTETWHFHTGEVIALPFVSVMEISGGMIRLWRDYSDLNTLLSKAPAWWLEHIAKFTVADFAPG
jgi:limonene-1,2-epoxide hydrolase